MHFTQKAQSALRVSSCTGNLFALHGCPPWQTLQQAAHREDDREERGHTEREQCPDKEEGSAGLGNRSADSRPLHVDDRDEQPKERPEEDDNVPRSLSGQHQRSVQPDGQDWHDDEVKKRSWLHPADDVARSVKRNEEDREERRDSERNVLLHWISPC